MFPYLAWLDPFYKPRKTTSNFITVDSENEGSEVDEPTNQDDTSKEYFISFHFPFALGMRAALAALVW